MTSKKKNTIKRKQIKRKIRTNRKNQANIKNRTNKRENIHKGGSIDNAFLASFEDNLKKVNLAIETYSGQHAIDNDKAQLFINSQINDVRKQAASDLINNTIYITLKDVDTTIEKLIIKLYTEHTDDFNSPKTNDIYLYSGQPKKSFYFMSVLALQYIKKHNFKEPTKFLSHLNNETFDIIGDDPIIILDDVSYSGTQLSDMVNNIYYDRVVIKKKQPPKIFIMLIALNDFSHKKLTMVPSVKKRDIILDYTKSPFKLLFLEERLYRPLIKILGFQRYFNLNMFFSIYTESYPYLSLYLDHKIAESISTYTIPLLYGPVVPSNYNYSDFFEKIDGLYEIIPSTSLFENDELSVLLNNFNDSNKTNINLKSGQYKLISKLLENLSKADIIDKSVEQASNKIQFYPFINSCNKNNQLLENISNDEIINLDYRLFLTPNGCIENTEDCVIINSEGIMYYLKNDLFEIITDITKDKAIELCKKINKFNCPTSWYKNGEFAMISK